jgi:hypothetical protein
MGRYMKKNSRLVVQFYDDDNDELLFEIKDRDHSDVGMFFTDNYANSIIRTELGDDAPPNITILVTGEFNRL